MPIRMVDDPGSSGNKKKSTGGKSNPLIALLPALISFLIKRPKLLIPAIVIIGGLYFFGGNLLPNLTEQVAENLQLSTGLEMSPEMYAKSEIYEPLSAGYKNDLPAKVSLEEFCPPRKNQGGQGSCVGWASGYAARSIMQSRATGNSPAQSAFSPASLYNQISLPGCNGAYIQNAMEVMLNKGVLPWRDFGYDENDCTRKPSQSQLQQASQFKTKGFQRLWENQGSTDINAIRQNIAQGAPVVIGMMVGGTFMSSMTGKKVWHPTQSDYNMYQFGGHAMCVMGYDDNLEGGAFQIMNSWGEDWGDRGFCWVRYKDFEFFTKEAYGLYPMGNATTEKPEALKISFGLVDNASQKNIKLKHKTDHLFTTVSDVTKGDRFKIEVTNNIECYTYVFGEETDGSSYVLFPYTEKHSPYCGIVGTRLFPKDQSLMADEVGNEDRILVVISKKELDYQDINSRINKASGTYEKKANSVLNKNALTVDYSDGDVITFNSDSNSGDLMYVMIEVGKK